MGVERFFEKIKSAPRNHTSSMKSGIHSIRPKRLRKDTLFRYTAEALARMTVWHPLSLKKAASVIYVNEYNVIFSSERYTYSIFVLRTNRCYAIEGTNASEDHFDYVRYFCFFF